MISFSFSVALLFLDANLCLGDWMNSHLVSSRSVVCLVPTNEANDHYIPLFVTRYKNSYPFADCFVITCAGNGQSP